MLSPPAASPPVHAIRQQPHWWARARGAGREWRARLLVLGSFLVGALALFAGALTTGAIFSEGDTVEFYIPLATVAGAALREGRLPLWTPGIYAGYPLFADGEVGPLYPPNLLLWFLFPIDAFVVWQRVLRFLLGASAAYFYARSLGLPRPAATVTGFAFGFGSFAIGQLHHANLADGAVWLPAVLGAFERALAARGQRRLRWIGVGGAALALTALAVHINPLLMSALALAGYAALRMVVWPAPGLPTDLAARLRASVGLVGGMGALGAALAAVQLLPLLELAGQAARGRGVDLEESVTGSFPPVHLVTLLFPYFFRGPDEIYWSPWFRWDTTLYVGVVPLALAIYALATARSAPGARALLASLATMAVVATLLAFGGYSPLPLYELLWHVPPFNVLRNPSRFTFLVAFALAALAGMGAARLAGMMEQGADPRAASPAAAAARRETGRLLVALVLGTLALGALLQLAQVVLQLSPGLLAALLAPYVSDRGRGLDGTAGDPSASLLWSLGPLGGATGRTLLALLLFAFLLYRWRAGRLSPAGGVGFLVGLCAADLVLFGLAFHPRQSLTDVTTPPPVAQLLMARLSDHERVLVDVGAVVAVPDRLLPLGIREASGYSSLAPARHSIFLEASSRDDRLLDLLGVRYRVFPRTSHPVPLPIAAYVDQDVRVYERPRPLPRAFLVGEILMAADPYAAAEVLTDSRFDPRRQAVVEGAVALPAEVAPDGGGVGLGAITWVAEGPEQVVLRVEARAPALLVLADAWYPGWVARIDGRETPIYPTDVLFRGVVVPAGSHEVRFSYEPLSLRLGAAISLLALLALVGLLWAPSLRSAREGKR